MPKHSGIQRKSFPSTTWRPFLVSSHESLLSHFPWIISFIFPFFSSEFTLVEWAKCTMAQGFARPTFEPPFRTSCWIATPRSSGRKRRRRGLLLGAKMNLIVIARPPALPIIVRLVVKLVTRYWCKLRVSDLKVLSNLFGRCCNNFFNGCYSLS